MKILVFGDIHGRTCWKKIIKKVNPDKIIFLGDYVTSHEDISEDDQLANFYEILNYKESNSEKVVLLRGNHDMEACNFYWAVCLPKFHNKNKFPKDRFLENTQWIYIYKDILFSHAGVSKTWLFNTGCDLNNINNLVPSEIFAFSPDSPWDDYGESITQPLTWIRPASLKKDKLNGFIQVVGHTTMSSCWCDENIWFCDALGQESFLVIEDDKFKINDQE